MLKVVTFMKQVAMGLQMEGNFGTAHVYRSSLNAIIAYCGEEDLLFSEVTSEWLKGFEVYLRSRGSRYTFVGRDVAGTPFPLICVRFVRFTIVPSILGKLLMYLICSVLFIPVLVPIINVRCVMTI